MKPRLSVIGLVVLLIGACSPRPATPDPQQIQASAVAAAQTMIAQTQAAIPPTPAFTDTPQPSPTPLAPPPTIAIPTLAFTPTTASGGGGGCAHPLQMSAAGPKHPTTIINQTNAVINLSLNLYEPNLFGECGAISFAGMGKNDSESIGLPSGNWYAYAWASGGGKNFTVEGSFTVSPSQTLKLNLCIRANGIKYSQSC